MILGVYGLSDVGKTSIIEKLTQKEIQKYKIERKRGITLKVGYAHYYDGDKIRYFLDVPGHQSFSLETLRNVDLIDYGIYIIDASKLGDILVRKQILRHLQVYTGILKDLDIPYGILINKAETVSKQVTLGFYKELARQELHHQWVYPICCLMKESVKDFKIKLKELLENFSEKTFQEKRFRVIKSFDVNGVGTLTSLRGGIIGGSNSIDLSEDTSLVKLFYYDDLIEDWVSASISNHKKVYNSNIATLELALDPFYSKNDKLKGKLFFSKKPEDSVIKKNFSLKASKNFSNVVKNSELTFLINGQCTTGHLKSIKNNRISVQLSKESTKVVLKEGYFVIGILAKNKSNNKSEIAFTGKIIKDE